MRSHQHQHVRKFMDHDAEIGLRPLSPLVLQPHAANPAKIDLVEAAGDGVKTGRVDDDVERVFPVAGLDPRRRDPLDRRFRDVDQFDIVLVVDLVIEGLERQPARAETVIPLESASPPRPDSSPAAGSCARRNRRSSRSPCGRSGCRGNCPARCRSRVRHRAFHKTPRAPRPKPRTRRAGPAYAGSRQRSPGSGRTFRDSPP